MKVKAEAFIIYDDNETTERFIVFAYNAYYPSGGFSDIVASFSTIESALAALKNTPLFRYEYIELFECRCNGLIQVDIKQTQIKLNEVSVD